MIHQLKQFDESLLTIFSLNPSEISRFFSIPLKKSTNIYQSIQNRNIKQLLVQDEKSCQIITIYDQEYPPQLKHIPDAPFVLYALGDVSLLKHVPAISVIGTRNPTRKAPDKLMRIVTPLVNRNWLIVSGLAYGIDSLAHQLALHYHGKTISVLGSGFNHVYPKKNINLFRQIARYGLVITEYPPDIPPKRYHFPERNRIISGLSS